jgi:hypothetical protein
MAPPQVRDLQALINEQNTALQPQYNLLDESIQQNQQSGEAQVAGVEAAKTKAFKGIEQGAQDKGMFFSGFAPNEQADYTASTYLPALAQLQSTIAQARSQLLGKKAELGKSAFDTAFQTREGDVKVLNDWNKMTAEQQFNASEADKQRVFEAQQNEKNRQSEASIASQNRAASSAKANSGPSPSQNMAAALSSKTGDDGYVSPGTWATMKNQWVSGGYGDPKSFDAAFAGYRNPKNSYYKIG